MDDEFTPPISTTQQRRPMPPSRITDPSSVVASCNWKRQLPLKRPSPPAYGKLPASDVEDAEYKLFLSHLRPDGKSYVLEIPVGDSAPPLRVKYEEEDECSGSAAVPRRRRRESISKRTWNFEAFKRRKTDEDSRTVRVIHPPRSPTSSSTVDVGGSLVDPDYRMFLNNIEVLGGSIILKWRNNVSVLYENEEKQEDKVHEQQEKVTELEGSPEENNLCPLDDSLRPSSSSESENWSYFSEILRHKPSLFRDRLMEVLTEPFDQKEYECMMSHISLRKPIVRYKHLRDDSVPYTIDKLGYSYLDHNPDIARCIESASDDHHKNFFLRGFFFWLKNLSASDAFKPWVPAIPESRYVAIDLGDGKLMFALQLDASDGEEAQEQEGKETHEKELRSNNTNIQSKDEKKE